MRSSETKVEPKRLLAVGIGFVSPDDSSAKKNLIFGVPLEASWLEKLVAFVPKSPLGVEDVPNPEKLIAPCEGPLCVDVAVVPKTAPVLVEDEGFTAPVELLVAVVLGV